MKPRPKLSEIYDIDKEPVSHKKYYGLSSVPTIWDTNKVNLPEYPDINIAVYQTKSGWLTSEVIDDEGSRGWMSSGASGERLGNTAYRERSGAGGYGYDTPDEAIRAYIDQYLHKETEPEITTTKITESYIEPELMEGVEPLSRADTASGWQRTRRGRMIYKSDLSLENEKESFVYDKIVNSPSYPRLLSIYKRHMRRLYSAGDPYLEERLKETELQPWELLTAHAGVMNAKSSTAKNLKELADNVFKETGLPRLPQGKFRGEDALDWDAVQG